MYFFVNALMSIFSWFVAAALYSRYFVAGTAEIGLVAGMNTSAAAANYSAILNSTVANSTGADATGPSPLSPRRFEILQASDPSATATGAIMHANKIGDLPLFATLGALAAVWLLAIVGLSLTIKPEYLHTFVSLQTGYADTQSIFLDHPSDDARRVEIFFCNERHWQAIRDRVRQWLLSAYATWQSLMPAFFTTDLQARIPDEFMPAQVVHELNAQAPGGRRPTVQNMGLLRRVSHAAIVTAEDSSNSDGGPRVPAPTAATHLEPTSLRSAKGLHRGATSEKRGTEAVYLDASEAAEARISLKPGGGSASLKLGNLGNLGRCLALRDLANLMGGYDLVYTPKIWTLMDERNLKLTESAAEVSKLCLCLIPASLRGFGHSAV
jgi:hypothetical protein